MKKKKTSSRITMTSQTTVLHMKRLNQTESPIFMILCVLCFQRQSFLTFICFTENLSKVAFQVLYMFFFVCLFEKNGVWAFLKRDGCSFRGGNFVNFLFTLPSLKRSTLN